MRDWDDEENKESFNQELQSVEPIKAYGGFQVRPKRRKLQ